MKKLLLMAMLFASLATFTGCGTPESIAYKTTAITATGVDGAMNGWGDYVRAGKATAADEARVRAALDKYLAAQAVERDVVKSAKTNPDPNAVNLASKAISDASASLIELIATLTKGAK